MVENVYLKEHFLRRHRRPAASCLGCNAKLSARKSWRVIGLENIPSRTVLEQAKVPPTVHYHATGRPFVFRVGRLHVRPRTSQMGRKHLLGSFE